MRVLLWLIRTQCAQGMGNLLNGEECNLGFALRKLLTEYNMKPILTRPQHRFYTDHKRYFETVIDVHQFSYVCRRGFSTMKFGFNACLGCSHHAQDSAPHHDLGCRHDGRGYTVVCGVLPF